MKHLLNWLRRKPLEHDLNRELQYHLERRIADLEQSGLSPIEARRQTVIEMGGITQIQEDVRDIWLTRWLRDFIYDLRFSLRLLAPQKLSFIHSNRRSVVDNRHRRHNRYLLSGRSNSAPRAPRTATLHNWF